MFGIYIHIPFCASKCAYCDFVSYAGKTELINSYLKALAQEASFYPLPARPKTVYIGGGTPSLLNINQIHFLLSFINKIFGGKFEEFTFECNPESLTEDKVRLLKQGGVNRISLGLQSFNDKELLRIGRAHNSMQFLQAYKAAAKYFDNINVDLIAALPSQTQASFLKSLKEVLSLTPAHISLYGLQVEEGTPLYEQGYSYDDDFYVSLLENAYNALTKYNYTQYEISNYALDGYASKHNINYWLSGSYLGLGAAASGYLFGTRYNNTPIVEEYIDSINKNERPFVFTETLEGKAKIGEQILLAFRYLKGFTPTPQMLEYFRGDFTDLLAAELIEKVGPVLRLSDKGKYLANQVFSRFVEPFQ